MMRFYWVRLELFGRGLVGSVYGLPRFGHESTQRRVVFGASNGGITVSVPAGRSQRNPEDAPLVVSTL